MAKTMCVLGGGLRSKTLVEIPPTSPLFPGASPGPVAFKEGASPNRIMKFLKSHDMKVVGAILHLGVFLVRIKGDGAASDVFRAVKLLEKNEEVKFAEPSCVTKLSDDLGDG